jgi:phospholipase C
VHILRSLILSIIYVLLASTTISVLSNISLIMPVAEAQTATRIKHLVVIFQENVAFDHYFADNKLIKEMRARGMSQIEITHELQVSKQIYTLHVRINKKKSKNSQCSTR